MKYHLKTGNNINAVCGAKNTPATFVFDLPGFLGHYAKDHECKKCVAKAIQQYKDEVDAILRKNKHEA